MATFEDVLNTLRDVADTAGKKTGELVEKTKLKMEINTVEKQISAAFEGLGRLMYDAHKTGEEIDELADSCYEAVEELQARVEELQRKLDDYNNAVRCKDCGAINVEDALFCKKCGKKL